MENKRAGVKIVEVRVFANMENKRLRVKIVEVRVFANTENERIGVLFALLKTLAKTASIIMLLLDTDLSPIVLIVIVFSIQM